MPDVDACIGPMLTAVSAPWERGSALRHIADNSKHHQVRLRHPVVAAIIALCSAFTLWETSGTLGATPVLWVGALAIVALMVASYRWPIPSLIALAIVSILVDSGCAFIFHRSVSFCIYAHAFVVGMWAYYQGVWGGAAMWALISAYQILWSGFYYGWEEVLSVNMGFVGLFAFCAILGCGIRQLNESLHAQAESLRRREAMELQLAGRIHDSISSELTHAVYALRSGANESEVEESLRQINVDLRSVLNDLKEPEKSPAPAQGDDDAFERQLQACMDESQQRLEQDGIRGTCMVRTVGRHLDVSPAVRDTALLALRECFTNLQRHADRNSEYDVSAVIEPDGVSIAAVNAIGDQREGLEGGHGLELLRQQVESLGGELVAAAAGTQWMTVISIPYDRETDEGGR